MAEPHYPEKLIAFSLGDLSAEEEVDLRAHLRDCVECREFLSFTQDFNASLAAARPAFCELDKEACPDVSLIVALHRRELDDITAQHVRAHLFHCRECLEESLALERMRPKVVDITLRVARGIVHCLNPPEDAESQALPVTTTISGARHVFNGPYQVAQMLSDQVGTKRVVTLCVEDAMPEPPPGGLRGTVTVRVVVRSDEPADWALSVFDADGRELAVRMSLANADMRLDGGSYTFEILKAEDTLCVFKVAFGSFTSNEAMEAALEYLERGNYDRAVPILEEYQTGKRRLSELTELLWSKDTRKLEAAAAELKLVLLGLIKQSTDSLKRPVRP